MDPVDQAELIAQTLRGAGWNAAAFGDGVRIFLRRESGPVGVLMEAREGEWVARPDDVNSTEVMPGDRPFGLSDIDQTLAWAKATVQEIAERYGSERGPNFCPRCNGYGSSLSETTDRCSLCGGTGVATAV